MDVTVVAEAPRIGPHAARMRERLAARAGDRAGQRVGEGQEQRGDGVDRAGGGRRRPRRGADRPDGGPERDLLAPRPPPPPEPRRMAPWLDHLLRALAAAPPAAALRRPRRRRRPGEPRPPRPRRRGRALRRRCSPAQGIGRPLVVFLVVWPCNVAGALLVYFLGRRYGARLLRRPLGPRASCARPARAVSDRFYRRFGLGVIFAQPLPADVPRRGARSSPASRAWAPGAPPRLAPASARLVRRRSSTWARSRGATGGSSSPALAAAGRLARGSRGGRPRRGRGWWWWRTR